MGLIDHIAANRCYTSKTLPNALIPATNIGYAAFMLGAMGFTNTLTRSQRSDAL
jgi:hypothetical protein